jgi:type IV pilus assembly protein PilV
MQRRSSFQSVQSGFLLLEGLIAVLIFSIGVLAIVGMQAAAVTVVGDAKYRSDASILANELIGRMWASDRSKLKDDFSSPGGTAYLAWRNKVAATLPGVPIPGGGTLLPVVAVSDSGTTAGTVTVTIQWKAPKERATDPAHRHIVIAQIK